MENKTIQIAFNPLVVSVAEQLKNQGFKFNKNEVAEFENCRNTIFELSIHSLITDNGHGFAL